jgi:hypothetical protein
MLYCADERQGFDLFFELLEQFEASSRNYQQPEANLIVSDYKL